MKLHHILLVEDNEGDILLIDEALNDARILIDLSVVKDGKAAIDFLGKAGRYRDAMLPELVILDINLPKKNGHEVLKYIKENEMVKHIPVIIFTTSSSERDISQCYMNHANCYVTKPANVNDFLSVVGTMVNFWANMASLPPGMDSTSC